MFSKSIYIKRRETLKAKFNTGILLFMGNSDSPMNYRDNTYPFRQDSTFLYYFGVNEPGLTAVIDLDAGKEIIFGAEMTLDELVWMGRQRSLKDRCADSGINDVEPPDALKDLVEEANRYARKLHFLPPYRAENEIKLSLLLKLDILKLKAASSVEFIKAVIAQRSVKSAEELVEIDKAVSISADIHLMVMQTTRPGMYEREVVAAIQQAALAFGGNLAYPVILTVNGEILHNHYHGNLLKEGQLVLNDSGVETALGYAGDLTRTFPVAKKFTTEQKDIYEIVLKAYRDASAILSPGTKYLDVHFQACKSLVVGLKELGLMKGDPEDAVLAGAHTLFFQCGTGHMMGLDVHDMEDLGEEFVGYSDAMKKNTTEFGLKSLRLGKELQAGNVVTVEPGIYFNTELIDRYGSASLFADFIDYQRVQQFRDFGGIRIEDDFVIHNSGARMLGKHLASTITEIEDIRAGAF